MRLYMLQREGLKVAHKQGGARELLVRVPIGEGVRGRDITFEVHPTRLRPCCSRATSQATRVELAGVYCFLSCTSPC